MFMQCVLILIIFPNDQSWGKVSDYMVHGASGFISFLAHLAKGNVSSGPGGSMS
jgi:hypothetical protein